MLKLTLEDLTYLRTVLQERIEVTAPITEDTEEAFLMTHDLTEMVQAMKVLMPELKNVPESEIGKMARKQIHQTFMDRAVLEHIDAQLDEVYQEASQ